MIALDTMVDRPFVDRWPLLFGAGASGARGLLSAVAGSMITVAGVVFSITIVALSLTSNQYTPRVLRNFMRDGMNQTVLGVFVGNFAYCLVVFIDCCVFNEPRPTIGRPGIRRINRRPEGSCTAQPSIKALSPGVRDTTTAVTCNDHLTAILVRLVSRRIASPLRLEEEKLRLIVRAPNFEMLLGGSFNQIRANAKGNATLPSTTFSGKAGREVDLGGLGRRRPPLEGPVRRFVECCKEFHVKLSASPALY